MFRSRIRTLFSVLTVLGLAVSALAQSGQNPPAASSGNVAATPKATAPTATPRTLRVRHNSACWKEAGIAPEQINEEWKIRDAGKGKISGVCSDPKLTAEQRVQKIHEINAETDKEIANLIPPEQLSVYTSCKAQRDAEPKPKIPGEKELGPCGGVIPPMAKGQGAMTHDHSMMSNSKN